MVTQSMRRKKVKAGTKDGVQMQKCRKMRGIT